jgi:rhodanese-related sulfurtransferase
MIRSLLFRLLKRLIHLRFPDVQRITTQELSTQMNGHWKPVVLDARSTAEYAVSHLAEAQQVDPNASDIGQTLQNVSKTPIVVYCSVGYRSAAVVQHLKESGFTQVFNLEGGIFQWANEKRPLVQDQRLVEQVHPYSPFWAGLLHHP